MVSVCRCLDHWRTPWLGLGPTSDCDRLVGRLIYHGLIPIARYFAQSEIALLLRVSELMLPLSHSLLREALGGGGGPKVVNAGWSKEPPHESYKILKPYLIVAIVNFPIRNFW
jgi:hypothetical protein